MQAVTCVSDTVTFPIKIPGSICRQKVDVLECHGLSRCVFLFTSKPECISVGREPCRQTRWTTIVVVPSLNCFQSFYIAKPLCIAIYLEWDLPTWHLRDNPKLKLSLLYNKLDKDHKKGVEGDHIYVYLSVNWLYTHFWLFWWIHIITASYNMWSAYFEWIRIITEWDSTMLLLSFSFDLVKGISRFS